MPELHAATQLFHPALRVRAAVGEPVAVKLEVNITFIGILDQNVIGAQTGFDGQQLHIVIVVEQAQPLFFQRLAGLVQTLRQLPHRCLIAVVKAIHACDDQLVRAKAPCLLDHGLRLPLERAEIRVQAHDLEAALLYQRVPIKAAAVSGGHAGRAGHQPHHQ